MQTLGLFCTFKMKLDRMTSKASATPISEKSLKLIFSILTTAFQGSALLPFPSFVEKRLKNGNKN